MGWVEMKAGAPKGLIASSPGRGAEKLPSPGLVSLLRGKGASRSRGRAPLSRASPMFVARRRGGRGGEQAEVGEPSSPKVTCIGQVRIRNKKKGNKPSKPKASQKLRAAPLRCRCLCSALLCNPFLWKLKAGGLRRPLCGRWCVLPIRFRGASKYQQRKALEEEDIRNPQREKSPGGGGSDGDDGKDSEGKEEKGEAETRVFVSSATTTPPKNALLLMRCRSAPHNGGSTLATRIWVSPLTPYESPAEEEPGQEKGGRTEEEGPGSYSMASRDGAKDGEGEERCSSPGYPLVLTRSKSEPARKAAKLVAPEAPFCNNAATSNRRRLAALAQKEEPSPLLHH